MAHVVALFRKAAYSPNQHRANDIAILELTLGHLERVGWTVTRLDETIFDADTNATTESLLPAADIYLNMCQGSAASSRLLAMESAGAVLINRPSSVLGCHRHRLVPALTARGVRFPATEIFDLAAAGTVETIARSAIVRGAARDGHQVWIKRGDVHAERDGDVVAVAADRIADAATAFGARGIGRVAVQVHVAGPVLKFYGIADGGFFRYYDSATGPNGTRPPVDERALRALAFDAAAALGLDVFGGDVALPSPDEPVLIDLNDWPSFAPFRDEAAAEIAAYARTRADREPARGAAPDYSSLASDVA